MKHGGKVRNGMKYSAAAAGKAVGRSTATITRAIDKGRLSAVKDDNGAWQIDPSELHRVFEVKAPENPPMQSDEKTRNGGGLQHEVEILAEKLRSRDTLIDRLSDEVSDLRTRLDAEGEERRKLTAMITHQAQMPAPAPAVAPERVRRSWWPWGRAND